MNRLGLQLLSKILFFLLSAVNVEFCLAASAEDQKIYRVVLERVVKHEAPRKFVVWKTAIPSTTILSPRVPRHAPENQFIAGLRGLPPILQERLFESHDASLTPVAGFNVSTNSAAFVGFVDQATLRRFVTEEAGSTGLLAIGFSKVVYDQISGDALVYVEACMTNSDPVCGGEGYWLFQIGKNWTIKKQAYLWQGAAQPFWMLKGDVP